MYVDIILTFALAAFKILENEAVSCSLIPILFGNLTLFSHVLDCALNILTIMSKYFVHLLVFSSLNSTVS